MSSGVSSGLSDATGILQLLGGLFGSSSSGTSSGTSQTSGMSSEQLQNLLNTMQQMQSSGTSSGTSSTTLSPQMQALMNQVSTSVQPFNQGAYVAGQTQNIEAAGNQQQAQVNNEMASRGLATSPVAGTAQAGVQQNTLNQVNSMQQQAPLVAQQANLANLGAATSLIGAAPKTTTTTGTQTGTQTGSTAQTGSTTGTSTQQGNTSTNQNSTANQQGLLQTLFSDERLKTNIKRLPHEEALDKLMKLKPSSWKWKGDGSSDEGLVAQDVESVFPKAVGVDKGSGLKTLNMNALMPHIIASIQALKNGRTAEA